MNHLRATLRRLTALLAAGTVVSLQLLAAAQSPPPCDQVADPTPAARAANEKALEAAKDGDYAEALGLFQEAYDESPSWIILYNIGRMSRLSGDYKRALKAYSRYLREGADCVEPADRKEVEGEIESLQTLVGRLSISVNVEGADITVDGESVGRSPLGETVIENAGQRTIRASKEGAEAAEKTVELVAGQTVEVALVLELPDDEGGAKPTPDEPFELPLAGTPSELIVVTWITTGVLAVGAGVTGTLALVTSSDLEDTQYVSSGGAHGPPRDSDIIATRDRLHAFAVTTNWLIAGAVVTGTTALYLTIAKATENDEPAGPADGRAAPPPAVDVGVSPLGVSVSGTF